MNSTEAELRTIHNPKGIFQKVAALEIIPAGYRGQ